MTENGNYANLEIKDCVVASVGHYAGANISVVSSQPISLA